MAQFTEIVPYFANKIHISQAFLVPIMESELHAISEYWAGLKYNFVSN